MSEELPELTEKDLEIVNSLTPDLVERLFEGDNTPDREVRALDTFVKDVIDGHSTPTEAGTQQICKRYWWLLTQFKEVKERLLDHVRKLLVEKRELCDSIATDKARIQQLEGENKRLREALKQSHDLVVQSIMHGMPVTRTVAKARNDAVAALSGEPQ